MIYLSTKLIELCRHLRVCLEPQPQVTMKNVSTESLVLVRDSTKGTYNFKFYSFVTVLPHVLVNYTDYKPKHTQTLLTVTSSWMIQTIPKPKYPLGHTLLKSTSCIVPPLGAVLRLYIL